MDRDEFIDRLLERSGLDKSWRTPTGVKIGRFVREAVPCSCSDALCPGWQMVEPAPPIAVTTHPQVTVKQGA